MRRYTTLQNISVKKLAKAINQWNLSQCTAFPRSFNVQWVIIFMFLSLLLIVVLYHFSHWLQSNKYLISLHKDEILRIFQTVQDYSDIKKACPLSLADPDSPIGGQCSLASFPSLTVPFSPLPFPFPLLPLEVGPLNTARESMGSAVSSPSGVWDGAPAEIKFGA